MICEHCGNEIDRVYESDGQLHTMERCRDSVKAQFDALHVMWKNVSGALCDAGSVVVYERDYARSVRELTAERDQWKARAERAEDDHTAAEWEELASRANDAEAELEMLHAGDEEMTEQMESANRSERGAECINRRRGLVNSTSEPLRPGDRVVYRGGENPEYGIVIHVWHNEEIDCEDVYVAFFGDDFPTGRPPKPYVLRYFASSLERA